jgi:hypothetical protein
VPIPPSAKFLLIHMAHTLFNDRKLYKAKLNRSHMESKEIPLIKVQDSHRKAKYRSEMFMGEKEGKSGDAPLKSV